MKTSTYLLLFIGLGLFTILVGYHGVTDVAAALLRKLNEKIQHYAG